MCLIQTSRSVVPHPNMRPKATMLHAKNDSDTYSVFLSAQYRVHLTGVWRNAALSVTVCSSLLPS